MHNIMIPQELSGTLEAKWEKCAWGALLMWVKVISTGPLKKKIQNDDEIKYNLTSDTTDSFS